MLRVVTIVVLSESQILPLRNSLVINELYIFSGPFNVNMQVVASVWYLLYFCLY